jgi:hypothetical protein
MRPADPVSKTGFPRSICMRPLSLMSGENSSLTNLQIANLAKPPNGKRKPPKLDKSLDVAKAACGSYLLRLVNWQGAKEQSP